MDIAVLSAERRTELGSAASRRLRGTGRLPAVLYGHGEEVVSLTVSEEEARDVLDREQHMVTLQVEGADQRALVREVQYDAFGIELLHMDFTRVALDEMVTVSVRVELHGTPKGALEGGVIEQPLAALDIQCRADAIPENFRVEVGELDINDMIHVGDIELPAGVGTSVDPQSVVAVVHPPRHAEEEEEEAPAEAGTEEPELIGRAAKEDEDAENKEE